MSLTSNHSERPLPFKQSKISSAALVTLFLAGLSVSPACMAAPQLQSLVPSSVNTSPDYFCTWNIQGYYTSYVKGKEKGQMKAAVDENQLFGKGQYQNWLGQFSKVKQDLYIVLDEGWDLPNQQIEVVPEMFPSYATGTQPERFKKLSDAIKQNGWRGVGLWMRADKKTDEFWAERLRWMQASGVPYWKVDYGNNSRDLEFRRRLTAMGRELAPDLIIETAMLPEAITFGDTFRTYDVDVPLSIAQTLSRVVTSLPFKAEAPAKGIINVEDEMNLGAALGCAYGVMRHSFVGNLPSGRQDFAFPPVTRDVKYCMDEVVRAVRWHRIAPAFAVGANEVAISSEKLTDTFVFQKDESWRHAVGKKVSESAPAAVTRGLPLPEVTLASGETKPFVVASRNPNGAVAVATLGRTLGATVEERKWVSGEVADVALQVGENSGPIGIFGRYHSLTLAFDKSVAGQRIIAQDLAGDNPQDITALVRIADGRVTIPGTVIDSVGLSAATAGDKSEPGLVLVIQKK